MDFQFADVFISFVLDLIRYLIFGSNPFSALFYLFLCLAVLGLFSRLLRI